MTKELIQQEILTPALFEGDKVYHTLADIKKRAELFVPDLSTKYGRKEIASFAMKIAKCKTGIDGIGKDLVAGAKAEIKLIDNKRKLVRDTLDALKEDVRKPLTDFEDAEKARVERLSNGVANIKETGERALATWGELSVNELHDFVSELEHKDDGTWEEFNDAAVKAIAESTKQIQLAMAKRMSYDAEQDELELLRKDKAERDKRDYEQKLKDDAVKAAALETERKAQQDKERVANEIKLAEVAKEQAEAELAASKQKVIDDAQYAAAAKIEAKKQAEADKEAALVRERAKVAAEDKAKVDAQAKLEANKKHTNMIHEQIAEVLETLSTKYSSFEIVEKIASGEVPNLSIRY